MLLGRKAVTDLGIVLTSKGNSANKGPYSQSTVFPVVTYGHESWTIKEAECRRIDAFDLWYWRRLLKVPWTVR